MPPDFRSCPPIFFLPPHGIFLGEKSWCFSAEKALKFAISARKNPRISAKTFFWRSPAFGRKICDFGQKKPSHFGENLCPLDFNFAPPISRSWRRPCCLCPPKLQLCPPKQGLCPKKRNRLSATGVQFEA